MSTFEINTLQTSFEHDIDIAQLKKDRENAQQRADVSDSALAQAREDLNSHLDQEKTAKITVNTVNKKASDIQAAYDAARKLMSPEIINAVAHFENTIGEMRTGMLAPLVSNSDSTTNTLNFNKWIEEQEHTIGKLSNFATQAKEHSDAVSRCVLDSKSRLSLCQESAAQAKADVQCIDDLISVEEDKQRLREEFTRNFQLLAEKSRMMRATLRDKQISESSFRTCGRSTPSVTPQAVTTAAMTLSKEAEEIMNEAIEMDKVDVDQIPLSPLSSTIIDSVDLDKANVIVFPSSQLYQGNYDELRNTDM